MSSLVRALPWITCLVLGSGLAAQRFNHFLPNTTGAWSDAQNWSRGAPGAQDVAVIPDSSEVMLDASPTLVAIWIEGRLVVPAGARVLVTVDYIRVHGGSGSLRAGSASAPFTGELEILLTDRSAAWVSGFGVESKRIEVTDGGAIELYGSDAKKPWTRLRDFGRGSWQGDSNILPTGFDRATLGLSEITGWDRGDVIAISSTDFDLDQAEVRTIDDRLATDRFRLDRNLDHRHYSGIEVPTARSIDMRASVGLLSRNIRIRGDTDATRRWGGDIILNGASSSSPRAAHFAFVEFADMGKYGQIGRYPVHYHRCGDMSGKASVTGCSFHHCYHRAVTVHATNDVELRDNVVFETFGHAFFLEDGSEEGNVLSHNLGMNIRTPRVYSHPDNDRKRLGQEMRSWGDGTSSYATTIGTAPETAYKFFRNHDQNPSVFWLSNIANRIEDNVAAGSEAYGFAYDFAGKDYGDDGRAVVIELFNFYHQKSNKRGGLRNTFVGPGREFSFKGNVAHSCDRVGIFSDEDGFGRARPIQDNGGGFEHLTLVFERCTAFKCRKAGVWYRQYGDARFTDCAFADNGVSVYFASEGWLEDEQFDVLYNRDVPHQPIFHAVKNWSWGRGGLPGAPSMAHMALHDSLVVGDSSNTGDPASPDWHEASGSQTPKIRRSLPYARFSMPNFRSRSGVQLTTHEIDRRPVARRIWLIGVTVYDGLLGIVDSEFVDFQDSWLGSSDERIAAAIVPNAVGQWSYVVGPSVANKFPVDPRNYTTGLRFVNVDNRTALVAPRQPRQVIRSPFADDDAMGWRFSTGVRDAVIHDLDGSLAGAPGYLLNAANPLLHGPSPFLVTSVRFPFVRHDESLSIAALHIEFPFDWNATANVTSLFRNLRLTRGSESISLFDTVSALVSSRADKGRQFRDPSLPRSSFNWRAKRLFGCTLEIGSGASCPQYEATFERPGATPILPDSDFAVRLRFGERDKGLCLVLPIRGKPSRVHIARPPSIGFGDSFLPIQSIGFRPGRRHTYESDTQIAESTSSAVFQQATSTAWWFETGTPHRLHMKLYLPPRPGVGAAGKEFSGRELILLVER